MGWDVDIAVRYRRLNSGRVLSVRQIMRRAARVDAIAPKLNEHGEQKLVCQWWREQCGIYRIPEFALFAIVNAAKRSYKLASYCKAEGMRAGIPDLMLAVPRFDIDAGGLFIEHKVKPNKASPEQLEVIDQFRRLGYHCIVSYSADESIRAIRGYLSRRPAT